MIRRHRARTDLFTPSGREHWLVVEDAGHEILAVRHLPPGADLAGQYLQQLLEHHEAGWKLHEFSSYWGYFYASKDGVQHYVQITGIDPAQPKSA